MEQIFAFLPQKFFTAFQSQKIFLKKNFYFGRFKKIGANNQNSVSTRFFCNLVMSRMPQTASRYLENCRRSTNFCEPLFFQWKLATLQTGNSANFQNILNRLSNRCLWRWYNCFWNYFNFFKKFLLMGGGSLKWNCKWNAKGNLQIGSTAKFRGDGENWMLHKYLTTQYYIYKPLTCVICQNAM